MKTNRELEDYLEQDKVYFADIILTIARHIKIILIAPIVLCLMTIIYAIFFTSPVYTSTSKIMSSSSGGGLSQTIGIAAQLGISIPTSQSEPKWVYPEILRSRTIARSVLKHKFDSIQFGSQKSLFDILTNQNNEGNMSFQRLELIAIRELLNMISISENIKTSIITFSVNASEPRLAAEINQKFIEELDSHQRNYNKAKTSQTRQFIESRIYDTEKELKSAEEFLKIFLDRNRRIENSPSLQLEQQRLAREVTVLTGVFTTLKQQLETTKIEELKESDYVITLDHPNIPLERSKPKKKRMVILAGFLGVGLGLMLAFIHEYLSNSEGEQKDRISEAKFLVYKNISEMVSGRSK